MSTHLNTLASLTTLLIIVSISCFGNTLVPGNDNFADRFVITGQSGSANGSNLGATHEVGEPWITPFIINGTNSVWWTWTCPSTGLYGFDTINSGFDTALGIFTGNTLSNLKKVAYGTSITYFNGSVVYNGYAYFNAVSGQTYQVSVSGSSDNDEGSIILNWYPDAFVAYKSEYPTNYFYNMYPAQNGSILQTHALTYSHETFKTNIKKIVVIDSDYENSFLNITVNDRKNNTIVDTNEFSGITGKVKWVTDFNGSGILVVERDLSTKEDDARVHLYAVSKKGLRKVNTYYVSNYFGNARFSKKGIYIYITDWSYWVDIQMSEFDKKMNKAVWTYRPSLYRGGFFPVYPNGVAVYRQWDPTTDYFFEIGKKGKPYGKRTINRPASGYLNFKLDDKGGILFWTWDNGTNGPMTYLDRRNNEVVTDFIPDSFSDFNRWEFDGKTLVLGKTTGNDIDIRTYKWGKKPKLNGTTTVARYKKLILVDYRFYIITTNGNAIAVKEFDKSLKKVKWETSGPGYEIKYLGKKVFYREKTNATTTTLTFFKKEKVIVEHEIDK